MRVLLVLGMLGVCASAACGGEIGGAPDGGGAEGGTPPTPDVRTFAIRTLYLGESDRSGGSPSSSAWKSYGYNLDGLVTTNTSTDVCAPYPSAPKMVDGNNGIDNSWGSTILPILQSATSEPTPSVQASAYLEKGASTVLIQVVGLSSDPAQSSKGLRAQVFAGGVYPGTPAFDASTDWPVLASSLADGASIAGGAKTTYPSAFVSNGTFVSGTATASSVTFDMALGWTWPLPITIHHALITFDHASPSEASNGTIAGVIDPSEFIATFKALAGAMSQSLCGSAFDGIAQQILMSQDIMLDGTNAYGEACSGISIGVGFTAELVANPTKVQADPPPPPNPCP